jgi:excinuclease UvrABC nuclease subunit
MKYLNALNKISGVGHKKMDILVSYFESGEAAWNASLRDLMSSGLDEKTIHSIVSERGKIDPDQ